MRIGLALSLAWVAGTATAQDPLPQVVQAIREEGCGMSDIEAMAVFPEMGIPMEQVSAVVDRLIAQGQATLQHNGTVIVLSEETCRPGDAGPGPQAQSLRRFLLTEMRARDCRLEESDAAELARAAGLSPGDLFREGRRLTADGLADLTRDQGTLVLTDAACRG